MDRARMLELATDHVGLAMLAVFVLLAMLSALVAYILHRAGWLEAGWVSNTDANDESLFPDGLD